MAWPAIDGGSRTLKVWIDRDGRRSKATTIELRHGRTYFYDAWRLPGGFPDLEGRDIWLRGTDLLGVERTWRGDWRVGADASAPTPPEF